MTEKIPKKSNRLFSFQSGRNWSEHLSFVMQIGLTMAGSIVFCFFLGRYLDDLLGLKGIMVTIMTILGVIGGAITVYRQIMEMTERDRKYSDSRKSKDI
ncbi:MAG: AtpZ/AtpI family protein [Desulfatirhabdiaceae bacterium]